MVNELGYEGIEFPVSRKDFCKIEKINKIYINVFCYENNLVYPVHTSKQKYKDYMDLFLINDENKPHYVCIKDFNRFIFNKTKHKNKKHFCRYYLQCFSSEMVLVEDKVVCLKMNGKPTVKLGNGSIKFRNNFKQLPAPFKIYPDVECNSEKIHINKRRNDTSHIEKN